MRVTFYALKPLQVGDEVRQAGDLVPEAAAWPYLSGYMERGDIAPVLVVTLPQATQDMLLDWEAEVLGVTAPPEQSDTTEPVKEPAKKTAKGA